MEHNVASDPMVWGELGNCVGVDQDLFFPERGDDTSQARALCHACAVRRQCLAYALETNQKFGIWGGMTEGQRRRLRRAEHLVEHTVELTVVSETDPEPAPSDQPRRHLRLVSLPTR